MVDRLNVSVDTDSPQTIRARGELDYNNCEVLNNFIKEALNNGNSTVKLSLAGLEFVDSSGLRVLATAAQEARHRGYALDIVSLTPQLAHMLDVSGFGTLFHRITRASEIGEPAPAREFAGDYSFEVEASTAACRIARDNVCEFAVSNGFRGFALEDIKLAVGEAVSNAVRHGNCNGEAICISCSMLDDMLRVVLDYPSAIFDADGVPIPNRDNIREGGMGIYFMRLLMDRLEYRFCDGRVSLILEKHLGSAPNR